MNLAAGEFEQQVAWLATHRRVIDLDTAVAELSSGAPVEPGVVITFDDGTADWIDVAAPILIRHNTPATFYLTTAYPEGTHPLPDGEPAISWAGVRELADTGVATIGSHTHTHTLLDRLPPAEIAEELDRSIELIGQHTGVAPRHFAYPKALEPSVPAATAVGQRFASAALAGTRANTQNADCQRLRRSPIQTADTFADFHRKVDGGMGFEDIVRGSINRVRYRALTR